MLSLLALAVVPALVSAGATVDPNKPLPYHSESGQYGFNNCSTTSTKSSKCQTAWMNSIEDFCVWGPPGTGQSIGDQEQRVVAYCTKKGHGTRLIPKGTITGVQWLSTKYYFQVTGVGDFTKIGIKKGDAGGELDPHGPTGAGNPVGGLVLRAQGGKNIQFTEWHNFIGANIFSFRACVPDTGHTYDYCPHIYDVMGAQWNDPGRYQKNYFQKCSADVGLQPGVFGGSTFHQGDGHTPQPHPAPASSKCTSVSAPGANYRASEERAGDEEHIVKEVKPTPKPAGRDL